MQIPACDKGVISVGDVQNLPLEVWKLNLLKLTDDRKMSRRKSIKEWAHVHQSHKESETQRHQWLRPKYPLHRGEGSGHSGGVCNTFRDRIMIWWGWGLGG
jgi:hypothetical protein